MWLRRYFSSPEICVKGLEIVARGFILEVVQ
jgi:hypothetical protein